MVEHTQFADTKQHIWFSRKEGHLIDHDDLRLEKKVKELRSKKWEDID